MHILKSEKKKSIHFQYLWRNKFPVGHMITFLWNKKNLDWNWSGFLPKESNVWPQPLLTLINQMPGWVQGSFPLKKDEGKGKVEKLMQLKEKNKISWCSIMKSQCHLGMHSKRWWWGGEGGNNSGHGRMEDEQERRMGFTFPCDFLEYTDLMNDHFFNNLSYIIPKLFSCQSVYGDGMYNLCI